MYGRFLCFSIFSEKQKAQSSAKSNVEGGIWKFEVRDGGGKTIYNMRQ